MSQHDLNIINADGATVRGDLNNALVALGSLQTGAVGSIPDTQPNMIVADTTSGHILKRTNADDAWDTLFPIDQRVLASAAGNDTYAITFAPVINAYVNGVIYRFKADVANTGACTLNINGVAAWGIQKRRQGALVDLNDNDIIANQICVCMADTTASKFILLNSTTLTPGATQSDQETGTSTVTYVTPSIQSKHRSAAKCFFVVTVAAGVPSLDANGSYNCSGVTDNGTGNLSVSWDTDFSGATNYSVIVCGGTTAADTRNVNIGSANKNTTDCQFFCMDETNTVQDPDAYYGCAFGDQ